MASLAVACLLSGSGLAHAGDPARCRGYDGEVAATALEGRWFVIARMENGASECQELTAELDDTCNMLLVFPHRRTAATYYGGRLELKDLSIVGGDGTSVEKCRASSHVGERDGGLSVGGIPWFRDRSECERKLLAGEPFMRGDPMRPLPAGFIPDCWFLAFGPVPPERPRKPAAAEQQVVNFLRRRGSFYWQGPHGRAPSCARWTAQPGRSDGLSGQLVSQARDGQLVRSRSLEYTLSLRHGFELRVGGPLEITLAHGKEVGRQGTSDLWTPSLTDNDARTVGVSGWFKTARFCRAAP